MLHFRGAVLPDGPDEFWVDDGAVRFAPPGGRADTELTGWAVPGLVDAHCHVGIVPDGEPTLERARELARDDVAVGVTAVREPGSNLDTTPLDSESDMPRFVRMGRHIALTRRYIPGLGVQLDDPSGLVDEVRRQAARGHGWVKIVGDWIDRSVGDLAPVWPDDLLAEAISVAHAAGARVASHVFGEDALPGLLAAGVDCIEHGSGLTDETIRVMAAQGTALVPTLVQIANFPSIAEPALGKYPTYAAHMQDLFDRRYETYRAAYEAGVQMYAGTDAGGFNAHGRLPVEIAELARVMPAEEALAAASWRAREWLGFAGIDDGAPADFVVYADDPVAVVAAGRTLAPATVVLRGHVAL
ncbi:amidohydrolase family protein [Tsukamurella sp. 8F]|uniref:amidohydrolase family protein n=1 Tax=unclassified Tsukamurella TaxID=2633480 RepID=UPI0023BA236B|nr:MULTISPECIES: amidohydrolase family protein [unclassified Tsukamurella]MDF0531240.1 amidohydrolase family protein [Tsukamurella sp. 8J]MDF0588509.1 amidohydrolase family protein [Tsukamurella sp. 8F]